MPSVHPLAQQHDLGARRAGETCNEEESTPTRSVGTPSGADDNISLLPSPAELGLVIPEEKPNARSMLSQLFMTCVPFILGTQVEGRG